MVKIIIVIKINTYVQSRTKIFIQGGSVSHTTKKGTCQIFLTYPYHLYSQLAPTLTIHSDRANWGTVSIHMDLKSYTFISSLENLIWLSYVNGLSTSHYLPHLESFQLFPNLGHTAPLLATGGRFLLFAILYDFVQSQQLAVHVKVRTSEPSKNTFLMKKV